MTSKTVAALLSDLEVIRSHSRPRVSNDNPYSEAWFKTLKFAPVFPERFGSLADARIFMAAFVDGYNHTHHHTGIGLNTPADLHYGLAVTKASERARTLAVARSKNPERFSTNQVPCHSHRGLDQPTKGKDRIRSSRLTPTGLKRLDKYRKGNHGVENYWITLRGSGQLTVDI
jgi:hypothetical protein